MAEELKHKPLPEIKGICPGLNNWRQFTMILLVSNKVDATFFKKGTGIIFRKDTRYFVVSTCDLINSKDKNITAHYLFGDVEDNEANSVQVALVLEKVVVDYNLVIMSVPDPTILLDKNILELNEIIANVIDKEDDDINIFRMPNFEIKKKKLDMVTEITETIYVTNYVKTCGIHVDFENDWKIPKKKKNPEKLHYIFEKKDDIEEYDGNPLLKKNKCVGITSFHTTEDDGKRFYFVIPTTIIKEIINGHILTQNLSPRKRIIKEAFVKPKNFFNIKYKTGKVENKATKKDIHVIYLLENGKKNTPYANLLKDDAIFSMNKEYFHIKNGLIWYENIQQFMTFPNFIHLIIKTNKKVLFVIYRNKKFISNEITFDSSA